jgi:hypothetical protein
MSLLGALSGQVQPGHFWPDPPSAYTSKRAIDVARIFTSLERGLLTSYSPLKIRSLVGCSPFLLFPYSGISHSGFDGGQPYHPCSLAVEPTAAAWTTPGTVGRARAVLCVEPGTTAHHHLAIAGDWRLPAIVSSIGIRFIKTASPIPSVASHVY